MRRQELSVALSDAFSISKVPDHLPVNAAGRKLHRHIAFRWALRGVRGIRLRVIEVPGIGKCTTREWLADFVSKVNISRQDGCETRRRAPTPRAPSHRKSTAEVLERHGLTPGIECKGEGGKR